MPGLKPIRRKFRLYRQFEADIWGNYSLNFQNTILGRYILMLFKEKTNNISLNRKKKVKNAKNKRFIYRVDFNNPKRLMKRVIENF